MRDKYLKYDVTQLVQDDQFAHWILDPSQDENQVWKKWLEEHPEAEEKFSEAAEIVKSLKFEKVKTQTSTGALWERIESNLSSPPQVKRKPINHKLLFVTALAASLALLLYIRINPSTIAIKSEHGQALIHVLPDGSEVHLNDGSQINYHNKSFGNNRKIRLEGEAFFKVSEGTPFLVETPAGSVQVLGTSFNVFSHNQLFEVYCKTGSVRVYSSTSEVTLVTGEKVIKNKERGLEKISANQHEITWMDGLYRYENVPLVEVRDELERQFDITIELSKELSQLKYTGFFQDDDLDRALQSVFWPLNLSARKNGRKISIHSD